jgi:hypothetical protein
MIRVQLAQAGIGALYQRSIGGPAWGPTGGQYIYVEAKDLERAREILSTAEVPSEDELIQAEEEDAAARRSARPEANEASESPAPKVNMIRAAIQKLTRPLEQKDEK